MSEREALLQARCWCCGEEVAPRDPDPWEGRMDGYCEPCSWARCDTTDSSCPREAGDRAENEDDELFLNRLRRLGMDWRYSDEFIGIVVRSRYPRDYDNA